MNLFENALPETLYHGTSNLRWAANQTNTLFLTSDREEAENYADDAVGSDVYDAYGDDFEGKEPPSHMVIIEFRIQDLLQFENRFEPDWGWEGADDATWRESLEEVGAFCIPDFTPAMKALGRITLYTGD